MKKGSRFTEADLGKMGLIQNKDGSYQRILGRALDQSKEDGKLIESSIFGGERIPGKMPKPQLFEYKLHMKPMSVNRAWQGKRFKTSEYKAYEDSALSILPHTVIPVGPYKLSLIFGVSSKLSDIDNPVKLFCDILQKKYNFNDKEIYELNVKKVLVPKRKEYCHFIIQTIKTTEL